MMRAEVLSGARDGVGPAASTRSDAIKAAILAGLFGIFLVWGVGFSPIEALHNAAHDTRHSNSFPCH